MASCKEIEPLVTAYVDGEANPADQVTVSSHLERCPPCRVQAERQSAARTVLRARARTLACAEASPALRARCAAHVKPSARPSARALPWAVAASFVLAAVLLVTFTARSTTVLAAQLAVDHVKCFEFVGAPTTDVHALEAKLQSGFGWHLTVPPGSAGASLTLLTARRCLYADGKIAHLLYRHHDRPVSLFVLPNVVRAPEELQVMGHEVVLWSSGRRSYVLVGRESRADLEAVAAYVKSSLGSQGLPKP
jgi:anti-sigma factor RsiW